MTTAHFQIAIIVVPLTLSAASAVAPPDGTDPRFNIVKPSTTGVPGEEVRVMTFDPQGNLWIAGRWTFWGECGLAMLSADQLPFTALPGGGFETGAWRVWSNVHHPIPSPYIFDMKFQSDGVAWIATEQGLTRFDRNAVTPQTMWYTYNTGNSPLIMNSVRSIDLDGQGNLWLVNVSVQYSFGALYRLNLATMQWTQYMVGQQLPWYAPWYNLNAVHVGRSGKVYVTHSVLGGFAEFNGKAWTYRSHNLPLGDILEDFDENVWFTSSQYGLLKWNRSSGTFQSFDLGSQGTITALGMNPDTGLVYAAAWYGDTFRMLNGTTPQYLFDAADIPGSIYPRPNGEIWMSNYGGNGNLGTVRQYSPGLQLLRRMNSFNSGLPDYFMDNIQKDRDGNMWFACGEGGLSRMEGSNGAPDAPTHWRNWGNHNDLAEPYPFAGNEPMYSMYHAPDGTIWMGGNGIAQWNPATGSFLNFWNWQNSNLGPDSFIAIEQDGNGDFWIASDYTGVYKLVDGNWQQHLFGAAYSTANYVRDMVRDQQGNLWVATLTSLHFFDGTTWFAVGSIQGSPVEQPRCLKVHPDGSLWIGASNGLIRYFNGQWTIYDENNSPMPTSEVQGLDIRSDGLIGMSVSRFQSTVPFPNGVVLFDGTDWNVYSYGTHPLPHYQLGDVEFDADGDIWVSTISEGVTEIVLDGPQPVPGDITGDGAVNVTDLLAVINAWGPCPKSGSCPADIAPPPNGDGVVNVSDLLMVINNWG